ncbi:MAG TPA: hypothetical protein VGG71_05475 [Chitinophagaceae bacterium]
MNKEVKMSDKEEQQIRDACRFIVRSLENCPEKENGEINLSSITFNALQNVKDELNDWMF